MEEWLGKVEDGSCILRVVMKEPETTTGSDEVACAGDVDSTVVLVS